MIIFQLTVKLLRSVKCLQCFLITETLNIYGRVNAHVRVSGRVFVSRTERVTKMGVFIVILCFLGY